MAATDLLMMCVFVLSFSRLKIIFFDFIFVRTFFSSLVCICFSRINAIHAIRRQQQQHTTKKSNLFFFHLNSHTQFHLNVKIRNSKRKYYRSRGHSHTHTMNWLKTDWTINAQTHSVSLWHSLSMQRRRIFTLNPDFDWNISQSKVSDNGMLYCLQSNQLFTLKWKKFTLCNGNEWKSKERHKQLNITSERNEKKINNIC